MNSAILVLALALFAAEVEVLVLRSGHQLPVSGPVEVQNGTVIFRDRSGVLYSLPIGEVDVEATKKLHSGEPAMDEESVEPKREEPMLRLRVSAAEKERLLRELEKSRGTPAPPEPRRARVASDETVEVRDRSEEHAWRAESRRLEENVRRRKEEIEMLQQRIQRLEDFIRMLLGSGASPAGFSYQVRQLEESRTELEYARLELTRAERELADFREHARREGILPGWLR